IEMDARASRDGRLMAIHDPLLDRTTDAVKKWRRKRNRVHTHDANSIQGLDAGSWFGQEFAGIHVPLLSEALRGIHKGNSLPLVERKAGMAEAYVSLFRKTSMLSSVVLQSFDWRFLHKVHELEPRVLLAALGPAAVLPNGRKPFGLSRRLTPLWLERAQSARASIVVWNRRVSRSAIRCAHDKGLSVWVYTIDDLRLARRLVDAGVDGIITNEPARLRTEL
ncbi:MAG: glycerophosphodiester phosphodiesterase, partial [Limisphaerales bacterium]